MKKQILFLIRAYNDMDIQAPLMATLGQNENLDIRVVGYPCDGYLGMPEDHETATWLQLSRNVHIESLLDQPRTPFILKTLHKLEIFVRNSRKKHIDAWSSYFLKLLHVALLRFFVGVFKKPRQWIRDVTRNWKPDAIVMDEVLVQPGRSQIVDEIVPALIGRGTHAYVIQTGQHVYPDPFSLTGVRPAYRASGAKVNFVPSTLDEKIYKEQFPQEQIRVMGNLRMDKDWIGTLSKTILPPPPKILTDDGSILSDDNRKAKVALMLSKLTYGVDADRMRDTIRKLGNMDDVVLAIKPHTRGMKFDFMDKDEIGHGKIVSKVPSSVLIDWADIVLVTGSSVVFHAMLQNKETGILKYCQKFDTIFDTGDCCHVFKDLNDLILRLNNIARGNSPLSEVRQKEIKEWILENVHAGEVRGNTATRYEKVILEDLCLTDHFTGIQPI